MCTKTGTSRRPSWQYACCISQLQEVSPATFACESCLQRLCFQSCWAPVPFMRNVIPRGENASWENRRRLRDAIGNAFTATGNPTGERVWWTPECYITQFSSHNRLGSEPHPVRHHHGGLSQVLRLRFLMWAGVGSSAWRTGNWDPRWPMEKRCLGHRHLGTLILSNLGRLVLGCREADVCKYELNLQHFSKSTKCAHFCTAFNSEIQQKICVLFSICTSAKLQQDVCWKFLNDASF